MSFARPVRVEDSYLLPVGSRVDPDRRARERDELADRNLDLDRVDVVVLDRVHALLGRERDQVERVEWTQPRQVEDRAEVDEERVVTLPGEDLDPAREVRDRFRRQTVVVRSRARPDVVRRSRDARSEDLALPDLLAPLVEVDERDAVGLWPVPVRVAERRD